MTALVRAGELSPEPSDRSRRLVEAAYLATITGQLDQVDRLLADAGQAPDTPTGLVFAATAHLLTNDEGDVDAAYRLLARALDDVADTTKTSGWDSHAILYSLLLVSLYTLRPEPWELLNKAMARFDPDTVTAFRLCHDAYVDPTRTSDDIRAGLARAFEDLPPDPAPWQLIPLAFAAVAMDAMSDYRHVVRHMIDRERDGGAIAMVIPGLMLLGHDSYVHGQWDEAGEAGECGAGPGDGLRLPLLGGSDSRPAGIRRGSSRRRGPRPGPEQADHDLGRATPRRGCSGLRPVGSTPRGHRPRRLR